MKMKKLFLLTLAAMLSIVTFAQKPFADQRANLGQKRIATVETSQRHVDLAQNGTSKMKAPKKAESDYEIISEQPEGTLVKYSRSGSYLYANNGTVYIGAQSGTTDFVFADDGVTVYIQDPVYDLQYGSWVKGTLNEDKTKLTVPTNQNLLYVAQYDACVALGVNKPWNTHNADITEITYTISDKTITLDTYTAYTAGTVGGFWTDDNSLQSYGEFNTVFTEFVPVDPADVVTPPEGLETKEMPFSALQYPAGENITGTVNVGIDGNDVWIQNLVPEAPGGWMKGTMEDNVVTFENDQLMYVDESGVGTYLIGFKNGVGIVPVQFTYDSDEDLYISTTFVFGTFTKGTIDYKTYYAVGLVIGTEEEPTLVEVPEGLQTETMNYVATGWYYNGNTQSNDEHPVETTVKVGFDGTTAYIQGLDERFFPEAWVKGTLADGKITVKAGQLIGVDGENNEYLIFLLGGNASGVTNAVFDYDPYVGKLTAENTVYITGARRALNYYHYYENTVLTRPAVEDRLYTFDFNAMDVPTSSNSSSDGDITEEKTILENGVSLSVSPTTTNTPNRFWNTNNGPQLRIYGGTLTIAVPEGSSDITKIVINNGKWNDGNSADSGSFDGYTWTGSAQKVVVTIAGNTQINNVQVKVGNNFDGAVAAEGDFFIYNLDSKTWLQNNDNGRQPQDWSTRAQVGKDGMAFGLVPVEGVENGFVLNPYFGHNHSMNASNWYLDTNDGATTWVLEEVEVEGYSNVYTIKSGEKALGVNTEGFLADDIEGKWQLITKEERMALAEKATAENPVDMTWLVNGHGFANQDERNNSWVAEGDQGGFAAASGDWVCKNTVFETWNLNTINVQQEITDLPNGKYVLQAQGAFVPTDGDRMNANDLNAFIAGELPNYGWFFANDEIAQMPSVYSTYSTESVENRTSRLEGVYYIAKNVGEVSALMMDGAYKCEPITVYVEDGKLTIGAKVVGAQTKTNWIMMDNFQLTYYGEDENYAPETVALTAVSADGEKYYATYFNGNKSFTVDENTVVKVADYDEETGTVVLFDTDAKEVPAGAAVVLESSAADITLTIGNSTNHFANNKLVGFQAPKAVESGDYYGLANKSNGIGFYKIVLTEVPANKAYLAAKYVANAEAKDFLPFGNGTDAIEGIENVTLEKVAVYNMQGQRVNAAQKGVYIVNGRKVVIK